MLLFDAHCHLDFNDPSLDDSFAAAQDMRLFCTTCSPAEYAEAKRRFGHLPHIVVGCGLHPRWIADDICGEKDVEALCQEIPRNTLIGEVGLDFLSPYRHAKTAQIEALDRIVRACSCEGGRILSMHALRSAGETLDMIEKHHATENCQCIMHWFSGSSDQLHRAIRLGCWFSLNDRMLSSKKGREYAKVIPEGRLLLESDLPSQPGESAGADAIAASLARTLQLLQEIRGRDCAGLCFENARRLLEASAACNAIPPLAP